MLVFYKKILAGFTLLLLFQSGFSQTNAKDNFLIDLRRGVSFEVSPYTGAMGKSGIIGLRLSMNYSSLNLEFAGEQIIGRAANLYPLALNFLLNLFTKGRLLPYGVLGGGLFITKLSEYEPDWASL